MGGDPDDRKEGSVFEDIKDRIMRQAFELGGTCTGEHGVGIYEKKFMELEHCRSYEFIRATKRLVNHKGLMNPDKNFFINCIISFFKSASCII